MAISNFVCDNEQQQKQTSLSNICFDGGYNRSLDNVECFANHIVASGREDGLPQVWILSPTTTSTKTPLIQKQEMKSDDEMKDNKSSSASMLTVPTLSSAKAGTKQQQQEHN
jgi:protease II